MILLGIWFVLQFLPAIGQTAVTDLAGGDNIAYLAHVGGFVFGLAAIKLFANRRHGDAARPPDPVYSSVNPDLRTALLVGGLLFVGLFAAMTLSVAIDDGVDILTFVAVAIIGMLALALIEAIRNPPDEAESGAQARFTGRANPGRRRVKRSRPMRSKLKPNILLLITDQQRAPVPLARGARAGCAS